MSTNQVVNRDLINSKVFYSLCTLVAQEQREHNYPYLVHNSSKELLIPQEIPEEKLHAAIREIVPLVKNRLFISSVLYKINKETLAVNLTIEQSQECNTKIQNILFECFGNNVQNLPFDPEPFLQEEVSRFSHFWEKVNNELAPLLILPKSFREQRQLLTTLQTSLCYCANEQLIQQEKDEELKFSLKKNLIAKLSILQKNLTPDHLLALRKNRHHITQLQLNLQASPNLPLYHRTIRTLLIACPRLESLKFSHTAMSPTYEAFYFGHLHLRNIYFDKQQPLEQSVPLSRFPKLFCKHEQSLVYSISPSDASNIQVKQTWKKRYQQLLLLPPGKLTHKELVVWLADFVQAPSSLSLYVLASLSYHTHKLEPGTTPREIINKITYAILETLEKTLLSKKQHLYSSSEDEAYLFSSLAILLEKNSIITSNELLLRLQKTIINYLLAQQKVFVVSPNIAARHTFIQNLWETPLECHRALLFLDLTESHLHDFLTYESTFYNLFTTLEAIATTLEGRDSLCTKESHLELYQWVSLQQIFYTSMKYQHQEKEKTTKVFKKALLLFVDIFRIVSGKKKNPFAFPWEIFTLVNVSILLFNCKKYPDLQQIILQTVETQKDFVQLSNLFLKGSLTEKNLAHYPLSSSFKKDCLAYKPGF